MPTLATVYVPLRSPSTATSSSGNSRVSVKPQPVLRTYGKEPLPVKPSADSSVNARIVGRVLGDRGGFYSLKIGNEELNNVGVEEILDYVSADHLEDYENQQFAEETEVKRVAKLNEERLAIEKQERRAERARLKGVAGYHDGTGEPGGDEYVAGVIEGKHGRARPNYKHLFKKLKERRKRKRNPITRELMPLSNEEQDVEANQSSRDDSPAPAAPSREPIRAQTDEQKRRRRKRDLITGELIPLAPLPEATIGEEKKRRRRKRHPVTGELMPYGWPYEPNGPSVRPPSNTRRTVTGNMSPAMNRLSITSEQPAKRLKMEGQSSSGGSPSAHVIIASSARVASSDSTSSSEEEPALKSWAAPPQSTPRLPRSASKGKLSLPAMLQSTVTSFAPESSSEPDLAKSLIRSPGADNTTSMMQPAALESPDEESDEPGDGEWAIEAILAHHMSDPRTHPRELGNKAVMLYQVKWEGFDEPSWEPVESFPDRSVVEEYERRVTAPAAVGTGKSQNQGRGKELAAVKSVAPTKPMNRLLQPATEPATASNEPSDDDSDSDDAGSVDGSYLVESITAHHLSDPRTHATEFGKDPVMLYKVKWKGYEGHTWEPIDSFEERSVVRQYRARAGLPAIRDSSGNEDAEMT